MVVMDFDGVLTDDLVYVSEDGREMVVCSRSDGMGLELLRKSGMKLAVISKEPNPVVSFRCNKLKIPYQQGIEEKFAVFQKIVADAGLKMEQVLYIGNDINDLECMAAAGYNATVADAHPEVLKRAQWILSRPGGKGAVREMCDAILFAKRKTAANISKSNHRDHRRNRERL